MNVTDANGCTDLISVTVADLSGLTASITAQTDADCNAAATGAVTVTASGSTPPYSYAIDGVTFGTSGTFAALVAGKRAGSRCNIGGGLSKHSHLAEHSAFTIG